MNKPATVLFEKDSSCTIRWYAGIALVIVFASGLGISHVFAANQTTIKDVSEVKDLLFEDSFAIITIIGILSLVVSLIVFSVGTNLRAREKKNEKFTIKNILDNLADLRNKVGDTNFTNLLNGLPSAAKEDLVFPEPLGVLRYKEFRRAITISVMLVYFALVAYSTLDSEQSANFKDNPVVQSFAWVFVAVIAFYFGDKIFETYTKSKGVTLSASVLDPITIEEATINQEGTKLKVRIRNNLKSTVQITKIFVDDKTYDIDPIDIKGEKSEPVDFDIDGGGNTVRVEVGGFGAKSEIKKEESKAPSDHDDGSHSGVSPEQDKKIRGALPKGHKGHKDDSHA